MGPGTRIWAYVHVLPGASVGRDCNLGDHCFVEGGARVGDAVTLKNGTMVWEGVTLEDGVFVGPGAVFTNDLWPRSPRHVAERYGDGGWLARTTVREGASIGARAVIVAGIEVGRYAMVGAGAVVTRGVADHSLVVGSPARHVGWVCVCGTRLGAADGTVSCDECGRGFTLAPTGPVPRD